MVLGLQTRVAYDFIKKIACKHSLKTKFLNILFGWKFEGSLPLQITATDFQQSLKQYANTRAHGAQLNF